MEVGFGFAAVILVAGAWIAVRVAMRRAISDAMPDMPSWVLITVALAMVIWAVLDATGIVYESPYRRIRTYLVGGMSAIVLIASAFGARKKAP
ncbi:MAG: hypothetical protein M3N49_12790 [Candidatus Eremiobacteraeota bacterium]|nr:hypothetical protein [Candidatus Eremiobacteraeota bacterium]